MIEEDKDSTTARVTISVVYEEAKMICDAAAEFSGVRLDPIVMILTPVPGQEMPNFKIAADFDTDLEALKLVFIKATKMITKLAATGDIPFEEKSHSFQKGWDKNED
jgi:hypothetical protein